MTISVIVATYRRPVDLLRCLRALSPQLSEGDRIIVVTRTGDTDSLEAILGLDVTRVDVSTPGVIHAENAGLVACGTDLVAFIDDDGVAPFDWLARIREHFERNPELGAVCGPVVPVVAGEPRRMPAAVWGRIRWYGRHIGNTDRIPPRVTECDIVRGCNMAFRRSLLAGFDTRLLGYWRFEDDAALRVKRLGHKVICDPELAVLHHLAPIRVEFSRGVSPRDAYCLNHNNTYVLGKHFPPLRFAVFAVYTFLLGDGQSLGLARLAWRLVRRRDRESVGFALSSMAGKVAGLRTLWA